MRNTLRFGLGVGCLVTLIPMGVCAGKPLLQDSDQIFTIARPEQFNGSATSAVARAVDFKRLKKEISRRADVVPLAPRTKPLELKGERNVIQLAVLYGYGEFPDVVNFTNEKSIPRTRVYPITAAAALKDVTYRGGSLRFVLSGENLFRTTDANQIARMWIDFNDGKGWVSLLPDEPVGVSYAGTGRKIITFKIVEQNGQESFARSVLYVKALETPVPDAEISITASTSYLGEYGSGTAYIYKSGSHTGLRTPVVVAEGFDLDNTMNWDELYNLLNRENLVETLRSYGRDLVVVNFTDSTTYIQRNAYLLQEVLAYVQTNRMDISDKLTLVGASMGGLVSRYALLDYEDRSINHGVHSWLSFDAPHTGANIPLGVQHFIRFYADIPESYRPDAAVEFLQAINSPAARQMLVTHHEQTNAVASPDPLFYALQQEFSTLGGYPVLPRKITIANGSGTGVGQPFDPGEKVIDYDYNILIAHLRGDVYALNVTSSLLYDGIFYVFLVGNESEQVNRYSPYSYDNAPGGARSTFQQLDEIDPGYGDIAANYPDHCFIPTISALGMTNYSMLHDDLGSQSNLSAAIHFDEFHFAVTNEEHVLITASNAPWIMRAVMEGYDSDGDGFDDYTEWFTGTDYTNAVSSAQATLHANLQTNAATLNLSWQMRRHVRYDLDETRSLNAGWTNAYTPEMLTSNGPVEYTFPVALSTDSTNAFYRLISSPMDPFD